MKKRSNKLNNKVVCACGEEVFINFMNKHLSNKCDASDEYKAFASHVMSVNTRISDKGIHRRGKAWLVADGIKARATKEWVVSVLNKKSDLSDWVFVHPVPAHMFAQCHEVASSRGGKVCLKSMSTTIQKWNGNVPMVTNGKPDLMLFRMELGAHNVLAYL